MENLGVGAAKFRMSPLKLGFFFTVTGMVAIGYYQRHKSVVSFGDEQGLTKENIAQVIGDSAAFYRFPEISELPYDLMPEKLTRELEASSSDKLSLGAQDTAQESKGQTQPSLLRSNVPIRIQYAFDMELQNEMEALFKSYRPDYGAFVAMDAVTGKILALVSYSRDLKMKENLALRATFPSASVFKVVTAAAAIEERNFSAETVIPFNGRSHTLYRSNVLKSKITPWTRFVTLRSAFANSNNTVFGKIGAYNVGPDELKEYAGRFGFNRKISSDLPIQEGQAPIPSGTWELAETASGFTRDNTMSPLQGALIAATIANDGVMMQPYVVDSVSTLSGFPIYTAQPEVANRVIDPKTAAEIRSLMRETVASGTSRRAFRGFFRGMDTYLEVGGKTGSLSGADPKGKYDWFVGFASNGSRKIALAALTIHEKLWRVKSSYLARRAFEEYFKDRGRQ